MTETLTEKKITTPTGYKHKCTNCMACYNICPSGAIEMIEDIDGFVYPSIVEDKCTHCGLCSKKCPALNLEQTKEISQRLETPLAYGGYINNEEIREKSSSGGVFSILSKYILDKGGCICGARFTKGGICEHVIVDNWNDLAPLRGSKYVQSNINNCFKEIKKLLEMDKYVLFTGTPCQVAGLYSVLGKDYEKLITVDLLCHGLPSQKLFREYLNEITDGREEEITEIKFRAKPEGWRKFYFEVLGKEFSITDPASSDTYFQSFCNNLTLRKSCTDCRYSSLPRKGDFTIGDFWGVARCDKDLDDNKGTSVILINSQKASEILGQLKQEFIKLKKISLNEAKLDNNWAFSNAPMHPHRPYFMKQYASGNYTSISKLINESLSKQDGIALLNFGDSKINYGCVLTALALQQKIRNCGYEPLNIRFYDNKSLNDINNLEDFQKEHMEFCAPCTTKNALANLNKHFQTFIVGSDTIWHDFKQPFDFNFYKFNFVNFSKNICAFAASFLLNKLEYTQAKKQEAKRLLKRFSHISVREKSGVKICKENFDIIATQVLDPVFFLNAQEWLNYAENGKQKEYSQDSCKIKYIINWGNLHESINDYINNIKNIKQLYFGETYAYVIANYAKIVGAFGVPIEEWIYSFSKCDMVYTDSFHGMCFSIIFNKPFILFGSSGKAFTRHESLMSLLGIPDRKANSIDDIKRLENEPIDWNSVNQKLQEHLRTAEEFLEKILYSHEHPDPVRGYMESLEILVEQKLNNEALKKSGNPPPARKNGTFWASMFSKNPCGMDTNGSIFLAYLLSKKSKKNTKLITNCSVS